MACLKAPFISRLMERGPPRTKSKDCVRAGGTRNTTMMGGEDELHGHPNLVFFFSLPLSASVCAPSVLEAIAKSAIIGPCRR